MIFILINLFQFLLISRLGTLYNQPFGLIFSFLAVVYLTTYGILHPARTRLMISTSMLVIINVSLTILGGLNPFFGLLAAYLLIIFAAMSLNYFVPRSLVLNFRFDNQEKILLAAGGLVLGLISAVINPSAFRLDYYTGLALFALTPLLAYAEELLFRFNLQQESTHLAGPIAGILLTSSLYAVMFVGGSLWGVGLAFLTSILLGTVYHLNRGNLAPSLLTNMSLKFLFILYLLFN